jgi:signal transduction histidine kinase
MAVILQNKLVGVLYLENDLVAFAFTPERCAVLEVLSAQAAISLENAQLYDTLERRVRERTQELDLRNEELSQALARLHQTQKQLVVQEKLASLGALTSGIAHEIKNPLNFVNNFADASLSLADELCAEIEGQRGRMDGEAAEAIEQIAGDLKQNARKISEHGRRADGIISAMLDHARLGVGERRETDVNAIVRDYVALARQGLRSGEGTEVALETAYEEGVGTAVLSGQDIGRVLINLVNNAVYAAEQRRRQAPPGFAPRVRVSTHDLDDRLEIRVLDNGVGIKAEVRDKIFTPFFTTKPPGEGTGLGLSISYDIVVQGHGGGLRFESREGDHTEFVVSLPRGRG